MQKKKTTTKTCKRPADSSISFVVPKKGVEEVKYQK